MTLLPIETGHQEALKNADEAFQAIYVGSQLTMVNLKSWIYFDECKQSVAYREIFGQGRQQG